MIHLPVESSRENSRRLNDVIASFPPRRGQTE